MGEIKMMWGNIRISTIFICRYLDKEENEIYEY